MRRRKGLWMLATLLALGALALAALDARLVVRRYSIASEKVEAPVRLALLSDLHECDYGENGGRLLEAVVAESPDAVLIAGDWFADGGDFSYGAAVLRELSARWPTCYVLGNHEAWTGREDDVVSLVRACGVTVLHMDSSILQVKGQRIRICGIPDPYAAATAHLSTEEQLAMAAAEIESSEFVVLLAHRPELIEKYARYPFDLVAAGHAHGGQVRLPGLVNGLCAPNQGWFPQYAGGLYGVGETAMAVSRGLSTQAQWYVPRVFNRPEVVMITLQPEG